MAGPARATCRSGRDLGSVGQGEEDNDVIDVQNALITPTRCCSDGIPDAVGNSLLVVFDDGKDSASPTVTNGP